MTGLACDRSSIVLQQQATLTNNLVVLPVSVNGSQPLPFILDTGASVTVIDRRQAESLGLAAAARADVSTGGGDVAASDIKGVTLQIGDLGLPDLNVIAIDMRGLSAGLGQPIAGILGYDIFHRYVVAIDYAAGLVTLHEAARYVAPGAGEIIPITIEEQTPFINASILGSLAAPPAKLELDTGKTGALTLVREYVDKYSLLRPGQREVAITAGALLPGQVPATVARVQGVQLGRSTVNEVLTMIVPDRDAAGVSGATVGLLGGELLKRFTVVIDYSRNLVILTPSARAVAEPLEFDMSGISLAAQGSDYRDYVVRTVVPGSPGAEAGVKGGDHLTAIDGKPARDRTLEQIRELFRKDGQLYALEFRRGDAAIHVDLRTRRLL
ncbi:MAG TPA: aspartyl protease family protein [Vicinamibacterales bacterium]